MLRESETTTLAPSSIAGARTCTSGPPPRAADLHQIIGKVCTMHPRGTAKWLQRVTGKSPRAVKYWLRCTYAPRGDDTLKITAALRAELAAHQEHLQQFELQL